MDSTLQRLIHDEWNAARDAGCDEDACLARVRRAVRSARPDLSDSEAEELVRFIRRGHSL